MQAKTSLWSIGSNAVVLLALGVAVPYAKGPDFLDSVVLGTYLCLSVLFAAPAAAKSFERPAPDFRAALARVAKCVLAGTLTTYAMLVAGVVVVYTTRIIVVGPDLRALGEMAVFALMLALAVTTLVAWISVRYSPGAGKAGARGIIFLGLLPLFLLN